MVLLKIPLTLWGLRFLPHCSEESGPISGLLELLLACPIQPLETGRLLFGNLLWRPVCLIEIFNPCMLSLWTPALRGDGVQSICESATSKFAFLNYLPWSLRNSPWTVGWNHYDVITESTNFCICSPVLPVPCLHFSGGARWLLFHSC